MDKKIKSIANNASKLELFSRKQVVNAIKVRFDDDVNSEDVRAYVLGIGFSCEEFKNLSHEDLEIQVKSKKGYCSTWAVFNALAKYARDNKLQEKRAKEEAEKAKAIEEAEKAEIARQQRAKELRNAQRREKRAQNKQNKQNSK